MFGKEGYIALLDVLGFEQLVARESYVEELQHYTETIREASVDSRLEFVLFSDTVVITAVDPSEDSLKTLIRTCSRLFGQLLTEKIPLRGAIARGSFIRDKTGAGVFLAGRAVVDAYRFEKKQNWVGILLTPSTLTHVPNLRKLCGIPGPNMTRPQLETDSLRLDWMRCVQPCNAVPFHTENSGESNLYDGLAIVPTKVDQWTKDGIMGEIREMQGALHLLKSLAPDPAAQRKYESTRQWLETVQGSWARGPAVWPGSPDFDKQ